MSDDTRPPTVCYSDVMRSTPFSASASMFFCSSDETLVRLNWYLVAHRSLVCAKVMMYDILPLTGRYLDNPKYLLILEMPRQSRR